MEKQTISNAPHEINYAAKQCNVPPYVIHVAKYCTGTSDRETVYNWIKNQKGRDLVITDFTREG